MMTLLHNQASRKSCLSLRSLRRRIKCPAEATAGHGIFVVQLKVGKISTQLGLVRHANTSPVTLLETDSFRQQKGVQEAIKRK